MKLFSIIIPIYNCEQYIERCLTSILNQNVKNIEIILINDGSTDKSGNICDVFSQKYPCIKVIHQENKGVSYSRNVGLKKSNGKYIVFMDSDDYLSENYFRDISEILEKNKSIELLNFGFYSEVENNEFKILSSDEIKYSKRFYKSKNEIKTDFINLWDNTMLYNIWNKIYVKKIIDENNIEFHKYNWGEDVEFNKLYLNKITNLYNIDKCYYHYIREREGSATKKFKENLFEIRKKEFYQFNEYFESWDIDKKEYYEFSCRRYIERVFGCIENIQSSNYQFMYRYKLIKLYINDPTTEEALRYIKPTSKKMKIMIIPLKMKLVSVTMLMGHFFHIIKSRYPSLFNKLKNRR